MHADVQPPAKKFYRPHGPLPLSAPSLPPLRPAGKASGDHRGSAWRSGRRGDRSRSNPTGTAVIRRTVCAAPGSFDCRGAAQGRRGFRCSPDRFARPPYLRKGGPNGPLFRLGIFSFDRPRPFSFRCLEKKMGAGSCGDPAPPEGRFFRETAKRARRDTWVPPYRGRAGGLPGGKVLRRAHRADEGLGTEPAAGHMGPALPGLAGGLPGEKVTGGHTGRHFAERKKFFLWLHVSVQLLPYATE